MKTLNNANHLTGTVLAALACVAFVGCSDANDRDAVSRTDTTVSHTTLAADDTANTLDTTGEVPPAAADAGSETSAAVNEGAHDVKTSAKKAKNSMKHKAKKAKHKAHNAWNRATTDDDIAVNHDADRDNDAYVYDTDYSSTTDFDSDSDSDSMDVSNQYDRETVSGVTTAPDTYRETGLSPFAQEPNSRMPKQIGSGQITGEDKSTTILEGPSLFQDPSALGRDLIR